LFDIQKTFVLIFYRKLIKRFELSISNYLLL